MAQVSCPHCGKPGDELLFSIACLTPGCPNYKPIKESPAPVAKMPAKAAVTGNPFTCSLLTNEAACGKTAFVKCDQCGAALCGSHVHMDGQRPICPTHTRTKIAIE